MGQAIERVLMYRLGSLGDMVAALPALHLVERAFPGAERRMLTNFPVNEKAAVAASILGGLVEGYFEYPLGSRKPLVLLRLWWQLVRWRPQVVVYLASGRGIEVARRDGRFFRLAGAGRLVGLPLTEDMQRNRPRAGTSEVEPEYARLARNIAELGDARVDEAEAWDLRLTDAERERAREAMAAVGDRPVVAFSLGTKLQVNDWGWERWRQVLGELGAIYPGLALVMTGVAAEREASDRVAEGWRQSAGEGGRVLNLCGELTPRESAACFARARVFVGHDSGPMHLAASVGTRVVAVFSSRNRPGKWFPCGAGHRVFYHEVDCMGCGLATCVVEGKKCIYGIGVGEVVGAVREVLGEG